MIRLGMVGKVLIHNYPYGAYFNGTDAELLEERCTKRWMLELIRGRFAEPAAKGSRITHVWAGDRSEAEAIAAGCRIENVTGSGGIEIGYYNRSVNLTGRTFSELILCDADNFSDMG